MSKRVIRVISIEGNAEWVDKTLASSSLQPGKTIFTRKGTVKEIQRVELRDDEQLAGPLEVRRK